MNAAIYFHPEAYTTTGPKLMGRNAVNRGRTTQQCPAKYRSLLIQNTMLQHHGTTVFAGTFKGMQFAERSAEGYYAVGLKRLYPEIEVLAFDINPTAQNACRSLAEKRT